MTATLAPMVDIIGGTFSKDSSGKGFVTEDAITSFISAEIAARRVPAPDSRIDLIYFVMLPNTVAYNTTHPQDGGRHAFSSYGAASSAASSDE